MGYVNLDIVQGGDGGGPAVLGVPPAALQLAFCDARGLLFAAPLVNGRPQSSKNLVAMLSAGSKTNRTYKIVLVEEH